jgi:hypothetical protein
MGGSVRRMAMDGRRKKARPAVPARVSPGMSAARDEPRPPAAGQGDDLIAIPRTTLIQILEGIAAIRERVEVIAEAREAVPSGQPPAASPGRTMYTVEETAGLLGRSEFQVRRWCQLGRIHAAKRAEKRGGVGVWSVAAAEVERYRNEGLLPIDPSRNAGQFASLTTAPRGRGPQSPA